MLERYATTFLFGKYFPAESRSRLREVVIREGRPDEAEELTELILRSKAYWGYSDEFMARVRTELVLRADQVVAHRTLVSEVDGRAAGVATVTGTPPHGELDLLFVDPWAI